MAAGGNNLQPFIAFVTVEPSATETAAHTFPMRNRRHFWLGWLPVATWMGLIFAGSTDGLSSTHTSRFIVPLLHWLFHDRLSEPAMEEIHHCIRKCAHLSEYAVLAGLAWNALRLSADSTGQTVPPGNRLRTYVLAIVLVTLYAASDEFHQSFVPSRGASVTDVLIDVTGGIGGLSLLYGCRRLRRRGAATLPSRDKS